MARGENRHYEARPAIAEKNEILIHLTSKFSNPAFVYLISSTGLSLKIGILLFSEEHLLIMR